jgi:uncharacterized metal-binding protein YceD (DUF177 family)
MLAPAAHRALAGLVAMGSMITASAFVQHAGRSWTLSHFPRTVRLCMTGRKGGSRSENNALWRDESVRRPGQPDDAPYQREPAVGKGRPAPRASGTLRLTRSDIEAALACADKNLASFQKEVTLADCDLGYLGRRNVGPSSKVCIDISVQRMTGNEFFLRAQMCGDFECECDRCLCPFDQKWETSFSLVLASRKQLTEIARRRADEEDNQDFLRYRKKVDESIVDFGPDVKFLDLKDDVADAVAGAVPRRALCNDECRGRCLSCGDRLRGDGACGCGAQGDGTVAASRQEEGNGLRSLEGGGAGAGGRGVGGGLNSDKLQALLSLKTKLEQQESG